MRPVDACGKVGQSGTVKVLVCDDYPLFRDWVRTSLRKHAAIEIIGEAKDGKEAVNEALRLRPDVVLMDISMPYLNGFEATRLIKQSASDIKVLILSMYEEEEYVRLGLEAGAAGYILKGIQPSALAAAINAVHAGDRYLSPEVLNKVVAHSR